MTKIISKVFLVYIVVNSYNLYAQNNAYPQKRMPESVKKMLNNKQIIPQGKRIVGAVPPVNTATEAEEFKQLLNESEKERQSKTVSVLNTLFDQDIAGKDAILLTQNNSNCNIIVRIQGSKSYKLAVPSHAENSMVVQKGTYQLNSNFCNAKYYANKEISKNMVVTLAVTNDQSAPQQYSLNK